MSIIDRSEWKKLTIEEDMKTAFDIKGVSVHISPDGDMTASVSREDFVKLSHRTAMYTKHMIYSYNASPNVLSYYSNYGPVTVIVGELTKDGNDVLKDMIRG